MPWRTAATPRQELERRLVGRAAEDEAFRALLLRDPKAAVKGNPDIDPCLTMASRLV